MAVDRNEGTNDGVEMFIQGDQGMVLENSLLGYRYEQRLLRLYNKNRQTSSNENKQ